MKHATQQAFGSDLNLCDDARRFLRQRATGSGGAGFSIRWFTTVGVTCADCLAVLARGANALPTPEVVQGAPVRDTNLRRAIRASMLEKYGPSIEDPEWSTEAYR